MKTLPIIEGKTVDWVETFPDTSTVEIFFTDGDSIKFEGISSGGYSILTATTNEGETTAFQT